MSTQHHRNNEKGYPPSYVVPAIICTFLCFPTAIISVKESILCERFSAEGSRDLAIIASRKAQRWLWYSALLGTASLCLLAFATYQLWPLIEDGVRIITPIIEDHLWNSPSYSF